MLIFPSSRSECPRKKPHGVGSGATKGPGGQFDPEVLLSPPPGTFYLMGDFAQGGRRESLPSLEGAAMPRRSGTSDMGRSLGHSSRWVGFGLLALGQQLFQDAGREILKPLRGRRRLHVAEHA